MAPHDGDDWVDLLAPAGIKLTFPRRMNRTSTEANLHINVLKDPVFLWSDYNHLTLYTGGIFIPDTQYIITIDSAALDLDGTPSGITKNLSFLTSPIRVTACSPQQAAMGRAHRHPPDTDVQHQCRPDLLCRGCLPGLAG
jgi:hypothetical protein